jgi:hypothetical protein
VVDAVTRFSTELVGSLLRLAQPSS